MKTHANTANRFTAWHQRKNALARDMVAFSRIGHFFLSQRVGGKSSVSVCCFKYGAFSRRIHIIGSRVATHSSIPHLFRQTKWRLVFSQGGISIWVGERNFSYSQCSKFYWAPTLPTLSWDGKNRSDEIHQWFQNMHAGISVDKNLRVKPFHCNKHQVQTQTVSL